jgi:hypothetical protein
MLPAVVKMATFLASHTCTASFHGSDGFQLEIASQKYSFK